MNADLFGLLMVVGAFAGVLAMVMAAYTLNLYLISIYGGCAL